MRPPWLVLQVQAQRIVYFQQMMQKKIIQFRTPGASLLLTVRLVKDIPQKDSVAVVVCITCSCVLSVVWL